MTQAQNNASNPEASCFVSANAGTGKTRVLTHRVLRLLLAGVSPNAILCLTFTNAAAAEMKQRVMNTLKEWSQAEEAALHKEIETLIDMPPSAQTVQHAKELYHAMLLGKQKASIQTIHGFCLELLQYFPIEAGLSPNVKLIEDRAVEQMMRRARESMLRADPVKDLLHDAINVITQRFGPSQCEDVFDELVKNRKHVIRLSKEYGGGDAHRKALMTHYGVEDPEGIAPENVRQNFLESFDRAKIKASAEILVSGKKTDAANAETLEQTLEALKRNHRDDDALIGRYCLVFLTTGNLPRKKLATADIVKQFPDCVTWMIDEQQRCLAYVEQQKISQNIAVSDALYHIGDAMVASYQRLKSDAGVIDFDDAIEVAQRLLSQGEMAEWVLYQLDQKIEHILIDEAQDTSPAQWQVIHALVSDFFTGSGTESVLQKTLFVVGDYKQSIYRFQGANPDLFRAYGEYFQNRAKQAEMPFLRLTLDRSFRTTPEVLSFVDHVFAVTSAKNGVVLEDAMKHPPHREAFGYVEVWPLIEAEKSEPLPPWHVASEYYAEEKSYVKLAQQLVQTIKQWLGSGRLLATQGRPVQAGDIMILLRSRGRIYEAVHHALAQANIPVSGQDRLALLSHLFTQDMLALARFLMNPRDDYSLACVLKSPLYRLDEDQLFALSYAREEASLYERLGDSETSQCGVAADELSELLAQVDHLSPVELFLQLLVKRDARARYIGMMGTEVLSLISVFFDQLAQYETQEIPSMHGFSFWLETLNLSIKQEMEEGGDVVRIMTVHGSKGLEAPIVMLPDTCSLPTLRNDHVMVHESELAGGEVLECWTSREEASALFTEQRDALRALEQQEYHRQLYVAMTRARDELYLMGAAAMNKALTEESWYSYASAAMASHPETREREHDDGQMIQCIGLPHKCGVTKERAEPLEEGIPSHLLSPAPKIKSKWRSPSEHDESPVARASKIGEYENSLIGCDDIPANEVGTIIHVLLQWLPEQSVEQRAEMGRFLLENGAIELSENQAEKIVSHALYLLNKESLQWIWQKDSHAELSVISAKGDARYAGQIDRLVWRDGVLWVIDYKTDKSPAESNETIPRAYQKQLQHYYQMVQPLYPDARVRLGLLYTVSGELLEVASGSHLSYAS